MKPTWQKRYPLDLSMPPTIGYVSAPSDQRPTHRNRTIYHKTPVLTWDDDINPQIRLLQIQPGTTDECLRCTLIKRPLWDAGIFQALSYSSGQEPRSCEISIEQKQAPSIPFLVTTHLRNALWRLRDGQEPVECLGRCALHQSRASHGAFAAGACYGASL